MDEKLVRRLKRTVFEFTGGFGIATYGTLTDEGIARLEDALKLEDLEIKQKGT
jgi:hypothetical protein